MRCKIELKNWNKEMSEVSAIQPISAILPSHNQISHTSVPLKNATAVEHVTTTETIDQDGRVIGVSKVVLTIYDRFGNLHDIPHQEKGKLY